MLSGCSDEETSLDSDTPKDKAELAKELSLRYGSWDKLCQYRPDCEDFPLGYETVIISNSFYYFPITISYTGLPTATGIPNRLSRRNPLRNFIQLDDDQETILRIVSVDKKSLGGSPFSESDHRLDFSWTSGLHRIARHLGIVESYYKGKFQGGFAGVFWVRKNDIKYNRSWQLKQHEAFLNEATINAIERYQVGSLHDYDKNFWFIDYKQSNNIKKTTSGSGSQHKLRFISKNPILFGQRLFLSCLSRRCSARVFSLPSELEDGELPSVGFSPPTFSLDTVLDKVDPRTVKCESGDITKCLPKIGLLRNAPKHLERIEKIFAFISTKPEDKKAVRN